MEQFWMVHGGGPTNYRHSSRDIAEEEAKRLARLHPGTTFFVTEAVSAHVKNDVFSVNFRVKAHPEHRDWACDCPDCVPF